MKYFSKITLAFCLVLSFVVVSGCVKKPTSSIEETLLGTDAETTIEVSEEAGFERQGLGTGDLFEHGEFFTYSGEGTYIGYNEEKNDILGTKQALYTFDTIENVSLEPGYIFFDADGASYKFDALSRLLQVQNDAGQYVDYHVDSTTITAQELASGFTYTFKGPQMIKDEEIRRIFVMRNNWPLTGTYFLSGGSDREIDIFVDDTKINTGVNEYVVRYHNRSGHNLMFDSWRVNLELE